MFQLRKNLLVILFGAIKVFVSKFTAEEIAIFVSQVLRKYKYSSRRLVNSLAPKHM